MSDLDEALAEAAARVDVIDCAGRIIAAPRRQATQASVAEVLALACAVETFWAIAIEAEILARAVRRPFLSGDERVDGERDQLIGRTARSITETMAAIRGETEKEPIHAGSNS